MRLPAFIAFLLAATGASAAIVTEADQEACKPDVLAFCKSAVMSSIISGNVTPLILCLKANRLVLSPICQAVLKKHGA
jgi:hypothetical protein